jgi:predicted transcriptional regulator
MAEMERRAAGELESVVLTALWSSDRPLTATQLNAELPGDLARTTVLTILSRLHEKGLLNRHRTGRGYAYSPVDERATRTASRMLSLLNDDPDRAAVLSRFISELSPDDEKFMLEVLARSQER